MSTLHRMLSALLAFRVLIASGPARAQSSNWDSMIWDQDVWFLPEPDLASMLLAGVVLLAVLARGRGAGRLRQ